MTPDITRATEDYLKAIWNLAEWGERKVTTKALAAKLAVSASTVSESIKRLTDQGLVTHPRYGAIELTDLGSRLAVGMVRRHRLIESFLVEHLAYTWDEAHDEAEHLEHACSEAFIDRIDETLGFPTRDPHGDPIPRGDGRIDYPSALLLAELEAGARGVVVRISDADADILRYFDSVGIALDCPVHVVERRDFAGVIALEVGTGEDVTSLDLGIPAAEAVWVSTGKDTR